ncbi:protein translocase subunit SecF [Mobiluncus mulieris]|uniref:protein translocase subunit SecF n=1 Tax=Mobiluncus mulieris TaxID=2052 RepID=UPI00019F9159|nr:protein translocase subunit SecF [Mobiluncus mulieris]EEJ54166.1 export membrane protein SecF [Mobiluncus mulieris ATCC 35243]MCU9970259.1 protein translocase subunit SecF [Mobiluncus mulieris]MCV0001749.1 protein translocase subunit SecF [Mobiluncus mulieris]NMW90012.1 protein translocase subunit SecF [Mobiluncus mulieris]SPX75911.1 preprotein translocase subunit SecF [Mobiluncus mulieris]
MMSYAEWGNALYSGKKSYQIIKNRRIFLTTGLVLVLIAIIGIAIFGVNPSIDFKGGTDFTVTNTQNNPPQQPAYDALKAAGITENPKVFQMGTNGLRVQTSQLATEKETQIQSELAKAYKVNVKNVSKGSVGPSWGASVSRQAAIGLVVFLAMVSLLLMAYFRTWTMAVSALFALMHDLMITIGAFAFTQVEVTPATIIGLLTILGYSLYDTVVVFDKIRENTKDMMNQSRSTYDELANLSINQTMVRSINTSITAILPVSAILFLGSVLLGASTLRDISMPLFIGMIVGTFSSIFIATPLLTIIRNHSQSIKNHNVKVETARQKALEQGSATLNPDGTVSTKPVVNAAPVQPGHHLGQAAQPKRKKKKN